MPTESSNHTLANSSMMTGADSVGEPISSVDAMRTAAAERVFRQYTRFENRMLAVRGDRLALGWSLWSR